MAAVSWWMYGVLSKNPLSKGRPMTSGRLIIALCVASAVVGPIASAQIPGPGDVDPSGRVLSKLTVTITESNAYGHPISGLQFLVAAESGDRISIRTDDAGTASAWVRPGRYRFVTPEPFSWRGTAYTWDVIVAIRVGTGIIELSQANASTIVGLNPGTVQSAITTPVPAMEAIGPSSAPQSLVRSRRIRDGFWFNLGFGYGVLGCSDCNGTTGGFTGGLALGGTLSPRFLLGVGTTGWTKSESGVTLTVGTLDARLRFYPSATGGLLFDRRTWRREYRGRPLRVWERKRNRSRGGSRARHGL
jgi:hypothetical protein